MRQISEVFMQKSMTDPPQNIFPQPALSPETTAHLVEMSGMESSFRADNE